MAEFGDRTKTDTKKFTADDGLDKFLLEEYEHIASAHFTTISTITSFFHHYLLIVALPFPVFAVLLQEHSAPAIPFIKTVMPFACLLLSVLGLFVMCYIISLRFDALLYARTINGVRKHFLRRAQPSISAEFEMRVLPRDIQVPPYFEKTHFIWVVLSFAIINATYFSSGVYLFLKWRSICEALPVGKYIICLFDILHLPPDVTAVFACIAVFTINLTAYRLLAGKMEKSQSKNWYLGLDIDGVLNKHREHFASILKRVTGKDIDPNAISRIPVSSCDGLNVTKQNEIAVFNTLDYWTEMPPDPNALSVLKTIVSEMPTCKLWIVTDRPWPELKALSAEEKKVVKKRWLINYSWLLEPRIKRITVQWLTKHGIKYDQLTVNISQSEMQHRWLIAKDNAIRIFVEDEPKKARLLSAYCDRVFLIDHPYNQGRIEDLPKNVIRVTSWGDLKIKLDQILYGI